MSRLPLVLALAVPLLLAAACDTKQSTATGAAPATPATDPDPAVSAAPAAQPSASDAQPAAAPAAPAPAADAGLAVGADAPVDPAALVGQYGFGWTGGKTMKCRKVDARMAKKLAGEESPCRHRDPGEAFAEGAGAWSSCQIGKAEWVIFATKAICQEQLETMEANAP